MTLHTEIIIGFMAIGVAVLFYGLALHWMIWNIISHPMGTGRKMTDKEKKYYQESMNRMKGIRRRYAELQKTEYKIQEYKIITQIEKKWHFPKIQN